VEFNFFSFTAQCIATLVVVDVTLFSDDVSLFSMVQILCPTSY